VVDRVEVWRGRDPKDDTKLLILESASHALVIVPEKPQLLLSDDWVGRKSHIFDPEPVLASPCT
jgi:hypothetical protein